MRPHETGGHDQGVAGSSGDDDFFGLSLAWLITLSTQNTSYLILSMFIIKVHPCLQFLHFSYI